MDNAEKRECCLEKLKKGEIKNLNKGDELEIITKTGGKFEAILYDLKEGYVFTISQMGILILFPIHSLLNIYQLSQKGILWKI